ncbi:PAS domain-containing protein [Methylobacterium mesophilicum]
MINQGSQLTRALVTAGIVGTWEWQIGNGGVVLDRGSAELLTGDAGLAGKVLDLDTSFACLHPDDRERVYALVSEHEQRGGPITMEYRVRLPDGRVRLLLDRGQVVEGRDGTRLGFGFLLDITEALPAGGTASDRSITALVDVTDQCLAMRDVMVQFGTPTMRLLFDMLLLELGRELAAHGLEPDARWVQ